MTLGVGQFRELMGVLGEIRDRMPGPAQREEQRPVTIDAPRGRLEMWVDGIGESHWVAPGGSTPDAWKRVYVRTDGR